MNTPTTVANAADKPPADRRRAPGLHRSKAVIAFLAVLSGGSVMGGCETRLKDAAVDTTRQFVLGLLDPLAIATSIFGEDLVDLDD